MLALSAVVQDSNRLNSDSLGLSLAKFNPGIAIAVSTVSAPITLSYARNPLRPFVLRNPPARPSEPPLSRVAMASLWLPYFLISSHFVAVGMGPMVLHVKALGKKKSIPLQLLFDEESGTRRLSISWVRVVFSQLIA